MSRNRWIRLAACAACGTLAAAVAAAEPAGGLAPAGDCAEPRVAVRGEPGVPPAADEELAAPALADLDAFQVTGAPRDHFDPRDVGATRGIGGREAPPAPPVLERGACDAPGAVCVGAVPRGAGDVVISEPPPGTSDQPGAGVFR